MTEDGTWSDESDWQVGDEPLTDESGEASGPPPVVAVLDAKRQLSMGRGQQPPTLLR